MKNNIINFNGLSKSDAYSKAETFLSGIGFNLHKTVIKISFIENRAGKFWYIQSTHKGRKNKETNIDLYIDKLCGKIIRVDKD